MAIFCIRPKKFNVSGTGYRGAESNQGKPRMVGKVTGGGATIVPCESGQRRPGRTRNRPAVLDRSETICGGRLGEGRALERSKRHCPAARPRATAGSSRSPKV